jgi:hypothetical protein
MRPLHGAIGVLLLAVLASQQNDGVVDLLLQALSSPDLDERTAAGRALLDRGQSVRPALEHAARSPDLELSGRAKSLLASLDRRIDSLSFVPERIRKENADSCQKLLWRSTSALTAACEGRDWVDIVKSLEKQDIRIAHENDHQSGASSRFLAKKDIWISPAGIRHDLVLNFETTIQTSRTESTKTVHRSARAGLFSEPKISISEVRAKPSPAGTLLGLLFEEGDVSAAAVKYPIVEELSMEYGVIFDRWAELQSSGFHVLLRVTNGDRSAGKGFFFTVPSGLDPLQNNKGEKMEAGFVSKDVLGRFQSWGGNEWSSSNKAEDHQFWRLRRVSEESAQKPLAGKPPPVIRSAGDLRLLPEGVTALAIKEGDFTDEDCSSLILYPGIREITTSGADNISDGGVAHLARLPELERLELTTPRITDAGIKHLAAHPRLKDLSIPWSSQITDEGAAQLATINGLVRLSLWWSEGLTDAGLKHLSKLGELRELRLWGAGRITDSGLEAISTMTRLERVTLSHSKALTPAGVSSLAKMPSLRELHIGYASVDDEGLEALGRSSSLSEIELTGLEGVSDAGLLHLKSLKLKDLRIQQCQGVTDSGFKLLQSELRGKYRFE